MGLISASIKLNYVLILILLFFFLISEAAYSVSPPQQIKGEGQNKTLVLKIEKSTSLEALIVRAGYSLEDENTSFFLRDFMAMNTTVKSLSLLHKGTTIRLPLKYLNRNVGHTESTYLSSVVKSTKKKIVRKKEDRKSAIAAFSLDKSHILRNIKTLFQSLGDNVFIETEGLKIFSIGEKSELSLDRTFFPSIILHNEHIIIFDYTGVLPEELRNLLEISWPEFTIVSYSKGMDMKKLFSVLLNESGYLVYDSEKFIAGGSSQIEYYPDFVAFRRTDDFMNSDISLISLLGQHENKTPDSLLRWLNKNGINVVELPYNETQKALKKTNKASDIDKNMTTAEFTEKILTLFGHDFERNKKINLANNKAFSFTIMADLSINLGGRTKVIELSEISDHEILYAKKQGLDIFHINTKTEKMEIARNIVKFLALEFSNNPKKFSLPITPTNVRYRLFFPGVYAKSQKGVFFLTDSELETDLLENIMREEIAILKF